MTITEWTLCVAWDTGLSLNWLEPCSWAQCVLL